MIWPANDEQIVDLILKNEGGFVNIDIDSGHATNFGISTDTLASWRKEAVTISDVETMSVDEARQIYQSKYIVAPGFDQLSDIKLRAAMVDYGVLCGPVMATKSLQSNLGVPADGIMGPRTLLEANIFQPASIVINLLSADRIKFHCTRVTNQPDQLPFLMGWVNRALSFIE